MTKKIWITIAFCLFCVSLQAQLSNQSKVSLLTCGPGSEFYESFGHSAIRIQDDSLNIDYVFNYGVFSFNEPHFYLKFAQGRLPYMLAADYTEPFLQSYAYEGRSVTMQVLNMTPDEKNKLYALLEENYKPENRYYAYDFFRDNCATRIRDILQSSFSDSLFSHRQSANALTYRNLYYIYTTDQLWWRLSIDLLLGMRTDKKLNEWEYMYIPFDMEKQADTCILGHQKGGLVQQTDHLLRQTSTIPPTAVSPNIIFSILFLIALFITFFERRAHFYAKPFDILLYLALALLSTLILYLWLISDHYATKYNLNILWINPLAWILLFRLKRTSPAVIYAVMLCVLIALAGAVPGLLPQQFNTAAFPIMLTVLVRLWALRKAQKDKQ
ncbi:MAG: DUF4105 domain-containing protein [Bacteroidales bacterium]|nr:DUF4105 domain-containing protein [Bacteroidales bacterium]